jgi:hypothetical protein
MASMSPSADPRYLPSPYCHICGYDIGEPPWGESGTDPTFIICECCGCEFGYHDATLTALKRYRERWLGGGAKWRYGERPQEWNLDEQLARVPTALPPGIESLGRK